MSLCLYSIHKDTLFYIFEFITDNNWNNIILINEYMNLMFYKYYILQKYSKYVNDLFVQNIKMLEELKKIEGFPLDKFDRIDLYLKAE